MIDTDDLDNMSRRDLVELLEAYNETLAEAKRLRELADNLYDFAKWMQDEKRKDPVGLEVLKDRMYWRDD